MVKEGGEPHDDIFFEREDRAAASIGRDDAPIHDSAREQERLAQKYADEQSEDSRYAIERDTEELYELYQKAVPDFREVDNSEGYPLYYNRIWRYVESGREVPSWELKQNEGRDHLKVFYEKLQEIDPKNKPEHPSDVKPE